MKVKDAMVKDVIKISADDPLDKAIDLLSKKDISGMPVIKDENVVGILSESDILRKMGLKDLISIDVGDVDKIKKIQSLRVEDVMNKEIYFVKEDDDVTVAIRIMNEKDVNRLPVVNKKNKLVGILTRGDVIRVFARSLGSWLLLEKKGPLILETDVDRLLKIIEKSGSIATDDLAKILKVSEEKIEEWGRLLEEHGLIRMEYPAFGRPVLKAVKKVS